MIKKLNLNTELLKAQNLHKSGDLSSAEKIYKSILSKYPQHFDSIHSLALIKNAQKNNLEAERLINIALNLRSPSPIILLNHGLILAAANKNEDALKSFEKAIKLKSNFLEAHYNKAVVLGLLGRYEESILSYKKTLSINPNYKSAIFNICKSLLITGNLIESEEYFQKLLKINLDKSFVYNFRGQIFFETKDYVKARQDFEEALVLAPDDVGSLNNLGLTLKSLNYFGEAIALFEKCLKIHPSFIQANLNLASTYEACLKFDEAMNYYRKSIDMQPNNLLGRIGISNLFIKLKKYESSISECNQVLHIEPNNIHALNNMGICYFHMAELEKALLFFKKALSIQPNYINAMANCGETEIFLNKLSDARSTFKSLMAMDPSHQKALDGLAVASLRSCAWDNFDNTIDLLRSHIQQHISVINPFTLLGYIDDPELQLSCTKIYADSIFVSKHEELFKKEKRKHEKIRIGYVSADFREHATAFLIAELFEKHDRKRFDIYAFSFGADDQSIMRQRLINSFDKFYDVRGLSDKEVAELILENEIDILVDLKGYTGQARAGIFSYKPAPIQVNYLGFPSTMAVNFMDYFITDRIATSGSMTDSFSEKLVFLPNSYQINGCDREIDYRIPSKSEMGLPEHGFIFCSFNNNWKITPIIFDIWMRLLSKVPDSVLWLLKDNDYAEINILSEATKRGINKERIVFADRVPPKYHLARHKLADLFLDTTPCNAHTTASDALWSGVPLITYLGSTFASRVAGSILNAADLPELITNSLEQYEALALKIATDPKLSYSLKSKLLANRNQCALFNSSLYTHNLEKAFEIMYERHKNDLPIENIYI